MATAEGNSGTTAFVFTVSIGAADAAPVTVNYATADGTAVAGSDYTATSGTLTFAPGVVTQTVTVLGTGDTAFEPDQTFFLNLSGPANATISDSQGVGTIQNDDAAPTVAINDASASEAAGILTFTVTRTGSTEVPVTINYATADVSAVSTAGGPGTPDYSATSGTVNFAPSPASTATLTIAVALTNDVVYEAAEQFAVNLSAASGASIADAQGVGTITNDDAAPTISINDVSASEGGSAAFTVTLTGATALPIAVNYLTAEGTAVSTTGGPGTPDYAATSGTLTFNPSSAGTQTLTISVPLVNDGASEPTEQFAVNLSGPTNGATLSDAQGVATINDDDAVPTLQVNDLSVAEGNAGTTALTFTVSLSPGSGQTVTVNFATADGTALAGSDYTATSGTLTFAPGQTSKTVTVLVVGDTVFEANQTFSLNLSGPTNATIADAQGVGTITNDDAAPTFAINDVSASEATGTVTFTVTRTGATEASITVNYATAEGTAVAAAGGPGSPDYTSTSGALTFAPSLATTATQTFAVTLTNDAVYEAAEQYTVNLSAPTNATIADGVGVGTITNDDAAPTIAIADGSAEEDTGVSTLTVTLTGATALPIAVNYATVNGTAVAVAGGPGTPDYTTKAGTLTFNPSASATQTSSIAVTLTDDTTNEPTEQFAINLSGATNGAMLSDAQGVVTITDDDGEPSMEIDDVSANEGNAGTTALTFTVTMSAASAQTATVNYATADGTALAGTDYAAALGTLTFTPGETSKTVTVLAVGDAVYEMDQTFAVNLSGSTNATIGDGQGTGTITNDDTAPTLAIADVSGSESSGTLTFVVTRTGATEEMISVDYSTVDGTSRAAQDYIATSGTLTFVPSLSPTATQTVTVALVNDATFEPTETFSVELDDAANATITDETGTGTITNDGDVGPPETTITSAPNGTVTTSAAHIEFTADPPSAFTCSLDGATPTPCNSPVDLTHLANGAHTLAVAGVTSLGVPDPTPATASWTVATPAPVVTVTSGPPATTTSTDATITFDAADASGDAQPMTIRANIIAPGVTVTCSLDGNAATDCTSPVSFTGLAVGPHALVVRATDADSNVGTGRFEWTILAIDVPTTTAIPARFDPVTLPATGSDSNTPITIGILLLLAGTAAIVVAWRSRQVA